MRRQASLGLNPLSLSPFPLFSTRRPSPLLFCRRRPSLLAAALLLRSSPARPPCQPTVATQPGRRPCPTCCHRQQALTGCLVPHKP